MAIITTDSLSYADVAAAVASASSGDTVILPAGTATWNSTLSINKALDIYGAGIGLTNILNGQASTSAYCIAITVPDADVENPFRIHGMSIDGQWNGCGIYISRAYSASLGWVLAKNIRIYNIKFIECKSRAIEWGLLALGLVDNCTFYDCWQSGGVYGAFWRSWDQSIIPLSLGSEYAVYFEDNTIIITGTIGVETVISGGQGGRYVFRHNTINWLADQNLYMQICDAHGNQAVIDATTDPSSASSTGNHRGTVFTEIYENTITQTTSFTRGLRFFYHRGGISIVFNNTLNLYAGISLDWTMYEEDGPGRFSWLETWPGYDGIYNTYCWNNLRNTTEIVPEPTSSSAAFIQEDRDYFLLNDSFDGSSGIGVGLLAARPSSGLATASGHVDTWLTANYPNDSGGRNHPGGGVGYFATDAGPQGTLYRATDSSTWETYYTPYTYPHPLRDIEFEPDAYINENMSVDDTTANTYTSPPSFGAPSRFTRANY